MKQYQILSVLSEVMEIEVTYFRGTSYDLFRLFQTERVRKGEFQN